MKEFFMIFAAVMIVLGIAKIIFAFLNLREKKEE